jgi:predicted AAA+ superfamily ATPase
VLVSAIKFALRRITWALHTAAPSSGSSSTPSAKASRVIATCWSFRSRLVDHKSCDLLIGAVVIEGPKACGKTETARQYTASEVLLDLDAEAQRAAAIDPRLVLPGAVPRLVDEWQREPRIWDAVRREVDARHSPGQFILTGSATPLDGTIRHSGAGRMAIVTMRPMTLFEQGFSSGTVSLGELFDGREPPGGTSALNLVAYVERIVVGGCPALLERSVRDAMAVTNGYIDTIVEHDIDVASGARRNPRLVRRFLQAYAQLTAHPSRLSTIVDRARGIAEHEAVGPMRSSRTWHPCAPSSASKFRPPLSPTPGRAWHWVAPRWRPYPQSGPILTNFQLPLVVRVACLTFSVNV